MRTMIIYHRIRVATPRHNGKAERQHREDGKRFYSKLRMYSLEDGRKQLAAYNKPSNSIPKVCLIQVTERSASRPLTSEHTIETVR